MKIWYVKITMKGEAQPHALGAIYKQQAPLRGDVINDLIVDGKTVSAKIVAFHTAPPGVNAYGVMAEEIVL